MRSQRLLLVTIALCVLLGIALVAEGTVAQVAIVLMVLGAAVVAAAPVREMVFIGWISLAPFWQEAARGSAFGTMLNNGAYLLAGAGIIVWAAALVFLRLSGRRSLSSAWPALLFGLWAAISLHGLEYVPAGWTAMDLLRQLYANVLLPISAFCVMAWGVERSTIDRMWTGLWLTSTGVSVLTMVGHFTKWQLWGDTGWQYVDIGRAVGPLANPAVLGTYLGVVIVSACAYLMWSRRDSKHATLAFTAIAFALPSLWFTYTRAPLLAVVVAVALVAARKSEYRLTFAVVLAISGLAVLLFWGYLGNSTLVTERIGNVSNAQARLLLASWSVELAAVHPILGWGYGSFDAAVLHAKGAIASIPTTFAAGDTSHNTFLTYLVELGLLGLGLYALAWVRPIRSAIGLISGGTSIDWRLVALLGGVIVFIVNAAFIDMRFFSLPVVMAWMSLGGLQSMVSQTGATNANDPKPQTGLGNAGA